MPRKAFISDLNAAKAAEFAGITQIVSKEDGEFSFLVQPEGVSITICIMEMSMYPDSHACIIFADDDASPTTAKAIGKIPDQSGKNIAQILATVSNRLAKGETAPNDENEYMAPSQSEWEADESSDDENNWGMDDPYPDMAYATQKSDAPTGMNTSFDDRTRQDLKIAKSNGLKIGALGRLINGAPCFITVACRFSKLGISEEAMQAWSVDPSHYLVLLLYYPTGYKSWDFLKFLPPTLASQHLKMHVGMCTSYKPSSFEDAKRSMNLLSNVKAKDHEEKPSSFCSTFISGAMDDILNERLLFILKEHIDHHKSWTEAEVMFEQSFRHTDPSRSPESLPNLPLKFRNLAALEFSECKVSLPLFAYEFLLRHFVHCTKFCLVCHRRLKTDVEAIKPYVCESDLCLYQYMSLGLGPSIDHEIIAQPYVVDTLISFCYASAKCKRLESFPTGLGLNVPHPEARLVCNKEGTLLNKTYGMLNDQSGSSAGNQSTVWTGESKSYKGTLDKYMERLVIEKSNCPTTLKTGDWILVCFHGSQHFVLCRIMDTRYLPRVSVGQTVRLGRSTAIQEDGRASLQESVSKQPVLKEPRDVTSNVRFTALDVNLDDLNKHEKCQSITLLLEGLPSVIEMRSYCLTGCKLSEWTGKISPAAFGLLRWIIASNRSCILQLDEFSDPNPASWDPSNIFRDANSAMWTTSNTLGLPNTLGLLNTLEAPNPANFATSNTLGVRHERVSGIPGYMQFRFATGSPEKEARFIQSVAEKTLGKPFPTLFAWHGSPLSNWHSIIRQGLHYKRTDHGRAFGNGCYHAKDFNTSGSYSSRDVLRDGLCWPNSCLQLSSAMALNEIVNCPSEFQSSKPHYVVQYIDWIQTRYLFVYPKNHFNFSESQTGSFLPQDPAQTPKGPSGEPIALPLITLSPSRRMQYGKLNQSIKNEDQEMSDADNVDGASVATLEEDNHLVKKYESSRPIKPITPVLAYSPVLPKTQLLPPPEYATSSASKQLQREMRSLVSVQEDALRNNALADLGWFFHTEHITETGNLYQWIISLHSFPLDLPLAKDMERVRVQEVLLEFRFAANFPLSPPFIRVIRPRFLPFMRGGGGHVTGGGSICMELLTNDGWLPSSNIESVLLQVRMAMMNLEPHPAKLDGVSSSKEYSVGEAVEAYIRACRAHGWRIPSELRQIVPTAGSY